MFNLYIIIALIAGIVAVTTLSICYIIFYFLDHDKYYVCHKLIKKQNKIFIIGQVACLICMIFIILTLYI